MPLNQVEDSHTANALLLMLEDQGFIFRCRVEIEEDLESKVISRKLVQIFFIPPDQIAYMNCYRKFIWGALTSLVGQPIQDNLGKYLVDLDLEWN